MKILGQNISRHALIKYSLLQIPDLIILMVILYFIDLWIGLDTLVFVGILAIWILKDILLFPFLWKAYDKSRHTDSFSLICETGTAIDRLAPTGYVRIRGELWKAVIDQDRPFAEKGDIVKVIHVDGLTLTVEKVDGDSFNKPSGEI